MVSLIPNKSHEKFKETFFHAWEKTIKNAYKPGFKLAHNSINNPRYPTQNAALSKKDLIKFTIIGNRVTREFIYCTNLVKALYKYRQKIFDAPTIRGVTEIEWPKIRNDLKIQYGGVVYCLQSQVAVILNDKIIGGEKELKEVVKSKYNYHIILDYIKEGNENFTNFIKASGRQFAYMHISIQDEHIGSLIFMLYSDIVPYTCENFLRLCQAMKGGYSGTPIHRIVKDGWIQCGGFGLKSSDLDCEHFIIPHDRRGVLCMANDGRHTDCSTQFFILLQPATWMAQRYVAFGQLVDGENTLQLIESCPTFYESPIHKIIIEKAGILNLDYQDLTINKNINEYLQAHIEDLVALGDLFYEELVDRVFLEIELKRNATENIEKEDVEEVNASADIARTNIRPTERFIRKKEDLEQLQESQIYNSKFSSMEAFEENNEFDVEMYNYETEESYKLASTRTASLIVKPVKPFYLSLTDVPYPEEIDSTYNLKKFLRGDYCLESDLIKDPPKKSVEANLSYLSEIYKFDEDSEVPSVESLSSEDEEEIRRYIKLNVDRVSFAGGVIKNIARGIGKYNIFEGTRKSELITDEELRRVRLASMDHRSKDSHEKKVSISLPSTKREPSKIKRRQTGFVRPEDLEKIYLIHKSSSRDLEPEEDESLSSSRKVRIADNMISEETSTRPPRRSTGFSQLTRKTTDPDTDVRRKSALSRLYENMTGNSDEGPTLKDYRPMGQTSLQKNYMLTKSPIARMKDGDSKKDYTHLRRSITIDDSTFEKVLNIQHDKKASRKISSDYVKTIDQIEHHNENSIRIAKTRPSLTVSEYQQRNLKNHEDLTKRSSNINEIKVQEKL